MRNTDRKIERERLLERNGRVYIYIPTDKGRRMGGAGAGLEATKGRGGSKTR